jgi:hypothetical protein
MGFDNFIVERISEIRVITGNLGHIWLLPQDQKLENVAFLTKCKGCEE